uniref:Teratocyte von Willebrand factor II n=1 Tax=Cotesia flavipes TaxID=89805 RepID=A0A8K1YTU2_COTFL|nr:teratocyte von Willebrand factor II [Cotesia flavipes]
MKTIAVLFASALIASLCLESRANCSNPNDPNGPHVTVGTKIQWGCGLFTCEKNQVWSGLTCAENRCPHPKFAPSYKLSESFPDCCPPPSC